MKEILQEEHAFIRFNSLLLAIFAAMALVLSLMSLIGITLGSAPLAGSATWLLARGLKQSAFLTLMPPGPVLFLARCPGLASTMMLALLPPRRSAKSDPMQALWCRPS
jgi:hypothetical protein